MADGNQFQNIIRDPEFLRFSRDDQRQILSSIDKDFAALDLQSQQSVLDQIAPRQQPTPLQQGRELIQGQEGLLAGGLIGGITGGVPGATVGGGIGQALQQAQQRPRTALEQTISTGLTGLPPAQLAFEAQRGVQTPQDIGKVAGAAAISGGSELAGMGAQLLVRGAVSPFKRILIENFQRAKDLFKTVGGRLTPGQATREAGLGGLIDFAEEFTEGSVTGGGFVRAFKEQQQKQIVKLSDNITQKIAGDLEQLSDDSIGEFVLASLKEGEAIHSSAASKLYTQLDETIGAGQVNLSPIKAAANKLDIPTTKGRELVLSSETRNAIKIINELDPQISFTELHGIRSGLLSKIRDLKDTPGNSQAIRQLNQLVSEINSTMETSAKQLSKEGQNLWQQANNFFKEGKQIFNDDILRKILQKENINTEKIGEKVFARGNVSEIRQLKRALDFTEQLSKGQIKASRRWQAMKAGHIRQLLVPDTEDRIVGNKIIRTLNDPKQLRTLKEIYTKEELEALKGLADVAQLTQKRLSAGGAIAAKIMQVSAAGQLIFSPFQAEGGVAKSVLDPLAGGIIIGPAVFGKLITSPAGIKWLTNGFKANLVSKGVRRTTADITRGLSAVLKRIAEEELNAS